MFHSFFKNNAKVLAAALSFFFNGLIFFPILISNDILTHSGQIMVDEQDSYNGLVKKLNHNDFQLSGLFLKTVVIVLGLDHQIKQGEYHFKAGEPVGGLFYKMMTGTVKQYAFKIIEGEDVFAVQQALQENGHLASSQWELTEGTLLPDTYFFVKGTTAQALIDRASLAQGVYLKSIWEEREPGLPWKSMEEAVIVGSILEKEARDIQERQKIAQVIVNRLKKNMRLQIDATAIYGLKDIKSVRYKHLKIKNALNTYQIEGLPIHPICMPSRDSLYAALHPQGEHDILYYVLMPDGSGRHHFSKTLSEHRKMKEKLKQ